MCCASVLSRGELVVQSKSLMLRNAEEIAITLGGAKAVSGGNWLCRCPAHDDREASLSVKEVGGELLFCCHAGCDWGSLAQALKARGIEKARSDESAKEALPRGIRQSWDDRPLERLYTYHHATGSPCGFVAVYRRPGESAKSCIPYFVRAGGSWRPKAGEERPLFNAHLIERAQTVVFCEGEKAAEALQNHLGSLAPDVCASTWPLGAKGFQKCDFSAVKGKRVILWPDNDEPGVNAMTGAQKKIEQAGAKGVQFVKIEALELELEEKEDAFDYFAKNPKAKFEDLPLAVRGNSVRALTPIDLTDEGALLRFERIFAGELHFCREIGWLRFCGTHWEKIDSGYIVTRLLPEVALDFEESSLYAPNEKAGKEFRKRAQHYRNIRPREAIERAARSSRVFAADFSEFDSHEHLLNTVGGTVDLYTGEHREHRASDKITTCLSTCAEKSPCPKWEKFVLDICSGDKERAGYLKRAIGYSVTGSTEEQVLFILWGQGSNGKSLFLETLSEILGDYAATTESAVLLKRKNTGVPNDVARLAEKRFVPCGETEQGAELYEAKVKLLTGRDTITARFLHKEFFEFRPQFKIWMHTNYRPTIKGQDDGVWRRVVLIPFSATFRGESRDPKLGEKLLAEAPGILNWCIEGAKEWRESGLQTPESILKQTADYKTDMDDLSEWITECCVRDNGTRDGKARELFESYRRFMKKSGSEPLSCHVFSNVLVDRGYEKKRSNSGYIYIGLRLKREHEKRSPLFDSPEIDEDFDFLEPH